LSYSESRFGSTGETNNRPVPEAKRDSVPEHSPSSKSPVQERREAGAPARMAVEAALLGTKIRDKISVRLIPDIEKPSVWRAFFSSGGGIRTRDLLVMSGRVAVAGRTSGYSYVPPFPAPDAPEYGRMSPNGGKFV
jgi:hypothetical protein